LGAGVQIFRFGVVIVVASRIGQPAIPLMGGG
jgi:hypothetical protein